MNLSQLLEPFFNFNPFGAHNILCVVANSNLKSDMFLNVYPLVEILFI